FRRERETGEDVGLVAYDEFLRQALGDVRVRTAGILADDLDLLAGDGVAVLLHIKLDAVVDLRRGVGKLAGIGADDADLDGFLGIGGRRQHDRRVPGPGRQPALHRGPPLKSTLLLLLLECLTFDTKKSAANRVFAAQIVGRLTISVQTVFVSSATASPARTGRCPSSLPGRFRGQRSIRRIPHRPPWYRVRTPAARPGPSAGYPSWRGSGRGIPSCSSGCKAPAAGRCPVAPCPTHGRTCASPPDRDRHGSWCRS